MQDAKLKKPAPGSTIKGSNNVVFTYVKENAPGSMKRFPPSVEIPEVDEIYMTWNDPKTGEEVEGIRQIRYSIGERSIFVDEQSEFAEKKREPIILMDGSLVVNEKEVTKMKYLELCNFNEANQETAMPGRNVIFRANDSDYKAKQALEHSQKITKLEQLVYGLSDEESEGLGLSLGLPFVKGVNSIEELKQRFLYEINKNPDEFKKSLDSDERKMKLVLYKAVEKNIISLDTKTNTIYNEVGNRTRIVEAPSYKDAYEYFVELSLLRDEYKIAYADIEKLVANNGKKTAKSKEWQKWAEHSSLTEAIKAKIVKNSFGSFSLNNHGLLGSDKKSIKKGMGMEVAVLYLRENPEVYGQMLDMLESFKKDQASE